MIAGSVLQVIMFFTIPYIIIKAANISKVVKFLSPVLVCYILGLILGNIPLNLNKDLAMTISEAMLPLAIPLILFNCDFLKWFSLAKKTLISFVLIVVSVMITTSLAAFLFHSRINEYDKISGMLMGCYTGGTPNLMAIGMGLNINSDLLTMVIAADTLMGGIYFLILISFGIRLSGKFLKPFNWDKTNKNITYHKENIKNNAININKDNYVKIVRIILLAVISAGLSIGFSYIVTGKLAVAPVMLGVTTFGIGFSFIKKVKNTKQSSYIGEYLIYVFSLAIATTVDINKLANMSYDIFIYTAVVMFGAIIIHMALSAIFNIDRDTAIITSTAAVYGPAFIAPIVSVLKNKKVMVSGMASGLIGYAIGNYFGYLMAYILGLI